MPDEYDSPWKEALEIYLRSMLEFCFPQVAAAIDWDAPQTFMDKELQEIAGDSVLGKQHGTSSFRWNCSMAARNGFWCTLKSNTNGI